MASYDVIVIGGGPGGYVAAIKAALGGKKTALVEKENLGGVCLNWGCIPTKSLLRNAEIVRDLAEGEKFGFSVGEIKTDYEKAQKRSRAVSARLVSGIEYLMKKNKITVYKDTARMSGKKELTLAGTGEKISGKNIIIATGSRPFALPMLDYAQANVLDSKKALQVTRAPKSIIIIGAGAIGMEFATVFSAYGAQVHVVEMLPRVLPNEDAEVSALVEKEFKKKGFDVHVGTKIVDVKNDGKKIKAQCEKDGKTFTIESEYILAATGIRPNTEDLNLKSFGVNINKRGYIEVDSNMRTNVQGIYAIGDVTGKLALAHTASAQGMHAVNDICGKRTEALNYNNIPKCTYAVPEVASAGLTEAKAKEEGYNVGTAVFPLSANGKAISYGDDTGFVKLVYDKKYGQLLGVHMAGIHVTEMVWGVVGYLGMEMTIEEMAEVVHPHPSVSEAIMEAAHMANGEPIHI
ncbi:MAG: dihydrolipoyl dehydrogenase [Christensenella sp.]